MKGLRCEEIAIVALGEPVRKETAELFFRCPRPERHNHGDAHPSLKVNSTKNIWGCFVCGVGGTAWQLAAFLAGLDPSDKAGVSDWLRQHGLLGAKGTAARVVAEYQYADERGALLYVVERRDPKDFRQRRPNGKGGWVWNLDGTRRVLYRLPEVLAARDLVLIPEGEKDCETAYSQGFSATCNSEGAGKWKPEYVESLRGKRACVIADADEPGRKHALEVAHSLFGSVESLKLMELPGAKDLTEWIEQGGTREALVELVRNTPEWSPAAIQGDTLLDSIFSFIRRFVSVSGVQALLMSLWVVHTHVFSMAEATPYLAITSAEKQSGKTRLLEVLETIVANPWLTGKVTAAVLIRKIDAERPTLLLDESDAAFAGEKEYAETLRGVLNTGHRRGGKASCCVGQGANISYRDFSTFCPKAIAGIGRLPDTVADRAIPIRLKRAGPGEGVERFRRRNVEQEAQALRGQITDWLALCAKDIAGVRPELPRELSDRQMDGSEPLLAIADLAGGEWPNKARAALIELCTVAQASDESIGRLLLADIRDIFESQGGIRISSAELACKLAEIETSPWGEWSHGKPITPARLARLLKPFDICPDCIRFDKRTVRGYWREQFEDAFGRYLWQESFSVPASGTPDPSATTQQTASDAGSTKDMNRNSETALAVPEGEMAAKNAACCTVAFSSPQDDAKGIEEDL